GSFAGALAEGAGAVEGSAEGVGAVGAGGAEGAAGGFPPHAARSTTDKRSWLRISRRYRAFRAPVNRHPAAVSRFGCLTPLDRFKPLACLGSELAGPALHAVRAAWRARVRHALLLAVLDAVEEVRVAVPVIDLVAADGQTDDCHLAVAARGRELR